jgi:hypothetical protein
MIHTYFVSYSYGLGFGSTRIDLDHLVENFEDINTFKRIIEVGMGIEDVVVLFYDLLDING